MLGMLAVAGPVTPEQGWYGAVHMQVAALPSLSSGRHIWRKGTRHTQSASDFHGRARIRATAIVRIYLRIGVIFSECQKIAR